MPESATAPAPAAAPAAPAAAPSATTAPAMPAVSRGASFFQRHADKAGNTANKPNATPPHRQQPPKATAATPNEPATPEPKPASAEPAGTEPVATSTEPVKTEPAVKPSTPAELPADTEIGKLAPKQLREAYSRRTKEANELRAEIARLKQGEKPTDAQVEAWKKERTEFETKLNSYEERLKFVDFQNSEEFKTAYQQPYIEAYQSGRDLMKSLTVKNAETGETTQLTDAHFDRLMSIQDPAQAAEYLDSLGLSGAKTQMVIEARAQCRGIQSKAAKAEADYKAKGGEMEKQRRERTEAETKAVKENISKSWQKHVSAPMQDEKIKSFFTPKEGDEKGNQLLKEGYEASNKAFKVMNPMDASLTPEEREGAIAAHAEMFNKAAAYNRLQYWYSGALKRLAAAEAKLKGYEESAPKGGDANGRQIAPGAQPKSIQDRFMKYADR